jgi:hypothetical protein
MALDSKAPGQLSAAASQAECYHAQQRPAWWGRAAGVSASRSCPGYGPQQWAQTSLTHPVIPRWIRPRTGPSLAPAPIHFGNWLSVQTGMLALPCFHHEPTLLTCTSSRRAAALTVAV